MIGRRTRIQLAIFAIITLVGTSYVGAKYAGLGRLFANESYRVVAHFARSGGIFTGAEVSYRGVTVGRVGAMKLTSSGVNVTLDIQNSSRRIPSRTKALVADRSAVGEQYVDLIPERSSGPYLHDGSQIPRSMTATPISPTKLLVDINTTVNSVNRQSLRTVVDQFGKAFKGTGPDLGRLVDDSSSFLDTANENFDVTSALLKDGNKVLATQIAKSSDIKQFARNLSLVSDTLANHDKDLRRVIEQGSATAIQLRRFLERNNVDLGDLINNLVTTGEVTAKHINGTEMILLVYPYVMSGGYTVLAKDPQTGLYDAHFGLITQQSPPVCHHGYESTHRRSPYNRGNRPMNTKAHCAEPQGQSNARGAQWAPRGRAPASYRAPVVGAYDPTTGTFTYTTKNPSAAVSYTGGAAALMGKESWKWLLLQPLAGSHG